jgi:hypothetical protein
MDPYKEANKLNGVVVDFWKSTEGEKQEGIRKK